MSRSSLDIRNPVDRIIIRECRECRAGLQTDRDLAILSVCKIILQPIYDRFQAKRVELREYGGALIFPMPLLGSVPASRLGSKEHDRCFYEAALEVEQEAVQFGIVPHLKFTSWDSLVGGKQARRGAQAPSISSLDMDSLKGVDTLLSGLGIFATVISIRGTGHVVMIVNLSSYTRPRQGPGCAVCGGLPGTDENGRHGKWPRCSRCKSMRYCSRECQKKHWSIHKSACRPHRQPVSREATVELLADAVGDLAI